MAKQPDPNPPTHPDVELFDVSNGFRRHLGIDVVRFRHRRFDGGWSGERTFDIIRRGGAVAVLLYDPEHDDVVLIEQFRLAALFAGQSPWQIEAVAGLLDHDGENPEEVARREAKEEANLEPVGALIPIQVFLPASGSLDEEVHLFVGRVDARGAAGIYGVEAEQEDIRVTVKSIAEVETMLDTGAIKSAHTLIMLYWLLRHRDRLRRQWLDQG